MEKDFAPYEQSLALKELGFNEPCFGKYLSSAQSNWKVYELILEMGMNEEFEDNRNVYFLDGACSAPTFSQAFKWFRKNYKLHQYIKQYYGERFYFDIEDMVFPRRYEEYPNENLRNFGEQSSQEEAELECLKQLIQIKKNGK